MTIERERERFHSRNYTENPTDATAVATETNRDKNVADCPLERIPARGSATTVSPLTCCIDSFLYGYPKERCQHRSRSEHTVCVTHSRFVLERLQRMYYYQSPKYFGKEFSSLRMPLARRRSPLASLIKERKVVSRSPRHRAVLPKWLHRTTHWHNQVYDVHRASATECFEQNSMVKMLLTRETASQEKECRLLERYRDLQIWNKVANISMQEDGTSSSKKDSIDSEMIFRQLNVLKQGGYWEHLPREEDHQESTPDLYNREETINGEVQAFVHEDENKENSRRNYHPNRNVQYSNSGEILTNINDDNGEVGDEDENEDEDEQGGDEYGGEREMDIGGTSVFVGSAFINGFGGAEPVGFYVDEITGDGWICSKFRQGKKKNSFNDDEDIGEREHHSKLLLRLPSKVALLGRLGMHVQGVNLLKRRDNGVVEPFDQYCVVDDIPVTLSARNGTY